MGTARRTSNGAQNFVTDAIVDAQHLPLVLLGAHIASLRDVSLAINRGSRLGFRPRGQA
jgi:hypothetical protein